VKVSPAGIALIKEFEGFPHGGRPYRDFAGVWTIGYGHTEGVGPNSPRITQSQASELLSRDLNNRYEPPVERLVSAGIIDFSQPEFDGVVSFVFNVGPGTLQAGRTMGDALRTKNRSRIAAAFLVYVKARDPRTGQLVTLAGLVRRRKAERALFLTEDDPLEGYPATERRWIHEYDKLVRQDRDRDRRRVLRRVMTERRKRIWHLAQPRAKGGDGRGWNHGLRRQRYASLHARTT
jgi:GH24 family phage-related lysozyme (muramidase)